jgi:hypothetical protein
MSNVRKVQRATTTAFRPVQLVMTKVFMDFADYFITFNYVSADRRSCIMQ